MSEDTPKSEPASSSILAKLKPKKVKAENTASSVVVTSLPTAQSTGESAGEIQMHAEATATLSESSVQDMLAILAPELAAPSAPFAPGTRIRFVAQKYLSEGFTRSPVLEPGLVIVVDEVVGPYSIVKLVTNSGPIGLAISHSDARDWVIEA